MLENNLALQRLRHELVLQLEYIIANLTHDGCKVPYSSVVHGSVLLRLYCALRGIAGIKWVVEVRSRVIFEIFDGVPSLSISSRPVRDLKVVRRGDIIMWLILFQVSRRRSASTSEIDDHLPTRYGRRCQIRFNRRLHAIRLSVSNQRIRIRNEDSFVVEMAFGKRLAFLREVSSSRPWTVNIVQDSEWSGEFFTDLST